MFGFWKSHFQNEAGVWIEVLQLWRESYPDTLLFIEDHRRKPQKRLTLAIRWYESSPRRHITVVSHPFCWRPPFQDETISDHDTLRIKSLLDHGLSQLKTSLSWVEPSGFVSNQPDPFHADTEHYSLTLALGRYVLTYVDKGDRPKQCRIGVEQVPKMGAFPWNLTLWTQELAWDADGTKLPMSQEEKAIVIQRVEGFLKDRLYRAVHTPPTG
jgi:hypothetical protein